MKLYFLSPPETELADPDASVIDAIKAELLRRPDIVEGTGPDDADAILIHEPWSFKEWRYIDRLLADPVISRHPHKTYTINVDDAATGLLRGVYASLPQRRLDPAIHATAPFLLQHNEFVLQRSREPRPQPTYLATWRGNPHSNPKLRGRLLEVCGQTPACHVESTASWMNHGTDEKSQYVDLLQSGKFSLCPAGWAPATFRVFESMALGIAPVIIADQFVPPSGPVWEDFSLRVAEADLPRIENELNRHGDRYLEMGQRAREAWQRYFRPDLLPSYYCDALLACIGSSAGSGSAEQEIKRWRSSEMFWANGWSIPQRISIKLRRLMH